MILAKYVRLANDEILEVTIMRDTGLVTSLLFVIVCGVWKVLVVLGVSLVRWTVKTG